MGPFGIVWRSIVDFYNELFPLIGMNVLWVIATFLLAFVSFPIVAMATSVPFELAPFVTMALLVLVPNPAAVGIHNYANQLVKEERIEFDLFKDGVRRYWKPALGLMVVGFLGFALLLGNIVFYLSTDLWIVHILGVLFIWALLLWGAMQLYLLPLLVEQEDKSYKLLYRNAALLAMDNIVMSLVLLVLLLAIAVVSVLIPPIVLLLAGSLVALAQHRATLILLDKYRTQGRVAR